MSVPKRTGTHEIGAADHQFRAICSGRCPVICWRLETDKNAEGDNKTMTTGGNKLVRGALVQWTMGNGYGVIVAVDERLITVRWDEEGIPTQFAAADPPLSRVDLVGKPVCRRSTGEDVAVLNPVAGAMPVWRCGIYPKSGSPMMSNVAEEDLRPLPITDPMERFQIGDIGSMKKYRLQEVTRWYRV